VAQAQPLHHAGTVHLDGPHAKSEVVSDHLVGPARQERVENLPSRRAASKALSALSPCPAGAIDALIAVSKTSSSADLLLLTVN
jgi:hypothetical protein